MEQRKKVMLQVGDVIYADYYGKVGGRLAITRVTKTQAITGKGTKFKREYREGGSITPHPYVSYSASSYYISTPELKAKFLRTKMENTVAAMKVDKLTDDDLKQIYNIITPTKPNQGLRERI